MKRWANTSFVLSLSVAVLFLVSGCGKKVTSSSGDTASERIKPEPIAAVPSAPGASGGSTAPGGMDIARAAPGGQEQAGRPDGGLAGTGGGAVGGLGGGPGGVGGGMAGGPGRGSELQDIYFDYDRFTVRTDGVQAMEQNARWLRAHKGQNLLIEGHCDERGTQAYNLVLGEKRARSAKRYLEDLGIAASQLQITSYGENKPVCKEQTESCYQRNRRAHFVAR